MNITIESSEYDFQPWRPEIGQVFDTVYAFDSETTLIDEQRPWITPAYVLGAAFDGNQGYFIRREHIAAFMAAHTNVPVVMHNAPFDLAVIKLVAGDLDIYDLVAQDLVWDTMLLHKLYMLGSEGHVARGRGQSTLERCAERYLGISLPKDLKDSQGCDVRLSYGKWLNRPPHEIEPVYLNYLAKDAIVTFLVYGELLHLLYGLQEECCEAFGYVDDAWLQDKWRRWGPQTHHTQLKGAIVLGQATANGLSLDRDRRDELDSSLEAQLDALKATLREYGYLPGEEGSGKALQKILATIERDNPDINLPRTPTDMITTKASNLEPLAEINPFIGALLAYQTTVKTRNTFLKKMACERIHPSFNPLVESGRTSSFGEINAQNLPRDDRVRACFIASPGMVFIDEDFATVEMATLSQAVITQFGIASQMGTAIDRGQDLHTLVAAQLTRKAEGDISKEERQKAKVVNFGKPGGMGDKTLQKFAKASYGMELHICDVWNLTEAWFQLFPEMRVFLGDEPDRGHDIAWHFGLSPLAYFEHTGSDRFLSHPEIEGHEHEPSSPLGGMCWRVAGEEQPMTRQGRPYTTDEIDFFWTKIAEHVEEFPKKYQVMIRERKACPELQNAVSRIAERGTCITATGRLRAKVGYCARHNTLFQGLAADGAKLALWELWRAGYRIVNFIHDEVLVEVPEDSNLKEHADTIRRLMIAGMKEVVPDVRIDVEYAASKRWYKNAKAVYDEEGLLLLWEPSDCVGEQEAVSAPGVIG